MSVNISVKSRRAEMRRRVDALPDEIKRWRARTSEQLDLEAHHSQLQALQILMKTYVDRQQIKLDGLPDEPGRFCDDLLDLVRDVIKAQSIWDFFRDMLELRYSPDFKEPLWVADTIAWNCHRPVMDRAVAAGVVDEAKLREPPLTYLAAEFSPATWVRGTRPPQLQSAALPIPVIFLPWDHVVNYWEFLTLHHEVAHDIETDLQLEDPLDASLQTRLQQEKVPQERIDVWRKWRAEVFADIVGLQLAGPAFADALMHLLLLPEHHVKHFNPSDVHPTHYVRILMNAAYIRTLIPKTSEEAHKDACQHADDIENRWKQIYGDAPQLSQYRDDFSIVFESLMDRELEILKDRTVRSLMPYTVADEQRIRQASAYLLSGQQPPADIEPRHAVSAARIALTSASESLDDNALKTALNDVQDRTEKLVRKHALGGVRAGTMSPDHKDFIRSFANPV